MNILVVSRMSIPATETTIPAWEYARSLGHTIDVCHPDNTLPNAYPDAIVSMGVTIQDETLYALRKFPGVPLFCYNWDCYEWIWEKGYEGMQQARNASRKREYDYVKYGKLLKRAKEVWVPSICTGKRTQQWWGITHWHTILSSVPYWEYKDIQDKGYVYCALREIPDKRWDILERACKELGLPLVMSKHERSYESYQGALAHCSFLVSHCYELSTGGLSLLEGYYLGKPCLLSNSEWHGGVDYMQTRCQYFQWDDFEHLKFMLQMMWNGRRELREPLNDGRDWVRKEFNDRVMIDHMLKRISYGLAD